MMIDCRVCGCVNCDEHQDEVKALEAREYRALDRLDEAEAIIAELVILKGIKDTIGKTADYEQRQPLAWARARVFLANKE